MELVVQLCILHLLGQAVILTVVAHAVHLSIETLDARLVLHNLSIAFVDITLQVCDVCIYLLDTSSHTFDFVLKVLNLERQLATESLDVVNLRKQALQCIQILQLLFHAVVCGVFLSLFSCHNCIYYLKIHQFIFTSANAETVFRKVRDT